MNIVKKIISFVYPIKIKKVPSERSGALEITLVNGKLVIDSENANYSYGSLQKVLKKGLLHIGADKLKKLENILVLGVAGGSVIQTLRNDFKVNTQITGVEIDPEINYLANEYFKLSNTIDLELITADAFEYIKKPHAKYDLIIIDIFNDTKMHDELFESSFWINIRNNLTNNGLCLFNSIYISKKEAKRNQQLANDLTPFYSSLNRIKTHQINELFVLER